MKMNFIFIIRPVAAMPIAPRKLLFLQKSSALGARIHRSLDERLIRYAHPGLKSWAEARDSQANR
jgi:hypothetical protein